MKQKTKITITALVVMLMMALAVTVISFSFAGETGSGSGTETDVAEATTSTNIDYIIKNSNDATLATNDQKYRIVEIHSGEVSTLGNYVANKGFEEYVINGNKSVDLEQVFATGKVKYNSFKASDLTKKSVSTSEVDEDGNPITDFAIISQADMIYISNSVSSGTGYSTSNDLNEDLMGLLQPMAVGAYIPIIIDMPNKSGSLTPGVEPPASDTTVGNIIGNYYATEGKYYYTFEYDNTWTAEQYYDSSLYLTINAKTQSKKGLYSNIKVGDSTSSMARMLVISKDGGAYAKADSMSAKLLEGATKVDGATYATTTEGETPVPVIAEGDTKSAVYNIRNTKLYSKGYNDRYDLYNPTYILLEDISLSDLATKTSLDQYDMVFIESDVKSVTTNETVTKLLTDAMYGAIHVTYAKEASDPTSSSGNSGNSETNDAAKDTNYKKFYDMIASNDVAAYQNIMLTDKSKIDTITGSTSAAVAKTIADLINASSYRGIGGPKSTASSFSVLEIQPCYPIDETIAVAENGYYSNPTAMINGLTLEEIIAQREQAGLSTSLDGSFEYYAWELSKAKIADALDMDAANITLTQMSTEEFSSYKKEILGNYDLVYIGGNNSAIKDFSKYYSWYKVTNDEKDAYVTRVINANETERLKYLPIYRMYSHNGDISTFNNLGTNGSGTSLLKTAKSVTVNTAGNTQTSVVGEGKYYDKSVTMLNGNDISSDNLKYLKVYVDAGMPIVFSSDVTAAYKYIADQNGADTKYLQNSIDPDSNMCKLLDYCNAKVGSAVSIDAGYSSTTNVLWNFHAVDKNGVAYTEEASSDGGRLSLYASKVKVLNTTQRTALKSLYTRAKTKPKLVLTDSPAIYNFFDNSTIIKSPDLKFRIDKSALNISQYSINLYIDDDGNSIFADSEKTTPSVTEDTANNEIVVKTTLDSSFFGPLYWKLELVDNTNTSHPKVYISGLSYVRPDDVPKQQVSVLQILPKNRVVGGKAEIAEGSGGLNGLYFCTECQEGYKNLYFNPSNHTSTFGQFSYYYSMGVTDDGNTTGTVDGIKMGLHEHKFGIVSYDSNTNQDDWSYNLANDLKNSYDFDVDIMYRAELDRYSTEIAGVYSGLTTEEEKEAKARDYNDQYIKLKSMYDDQMLIVKSAENALKDMIQNSTMMASAKKEILAKGSFSEYYALQNTEKGTPSVKAYKVRGMFYTEAGYNALEDKSGAQVYTTYNALYQAWVTEHDKAMLLKGGYYINSYTYEYIDWYIDMICSDITDEAQKVAKKTELKNLYTTSYNATKNDTDGGTARAMRIMGYKDCQKFANYGDWLKKTYTTVCIGVSERFADDDITNENSLAALDTYVANGGQLILFHDTLSPYSDSGAVQLTAHLREAAGLDKYHLGVKAASSEKVALSLLGNQTISVSYKGSDGKDVRVSADIDFGSNNTVKSLYIYGDANSDWSGQLQRDYNHGNPDYYDNSGITIPEGSEASNETVAVNVQCKYNGNGVSNTPVSITVGSFTASGTADNSGNAVFNVPVKYMGIPTDSSHYPVLTSLNSTKYPASDYYMTNLSYNSGDVAHTNFDSDYRSKFGNNSANYTFLPGGYSDTVYEMNGTASAGVGNYKYAGSISWSGIHAAMQDAQFNKGTDNYATNRAKKNNDAIVTMFPYQLADEIYIGGTHPQAFAADVDNDDLTILYSFIGGDAPHDNTTTFAANPGDGTDNYFMFACKNVYYCGAGHAKVTGAYKDNQNERYLYLNIICNAVRNSAFAPSIDVYDPDSTDTENGLKNDIIKKQSDGSYEYKIDENIEYPSFSFKAGVDQSLTLEKVEIYYDLDYLDTEIEDGTYVDGSPKKTIVKAQDGFTVGTDVMIATWGSSVTTPKVNVPYLNTSNLLVNSVDNRIAANVLGYILGSDTTYLKIYDDAGTATPYLKLKDSYFAPYGGKFTYIVIKVTDSNNNVRYQRIKISYKEKLFNLT